MANLAVLLWVFRVLSYDSSNSSFPRKVEFEGETWATYEYTEIDQPRWNIHRMPRGKVLKRMKHVARKLLRAKAFRKEWTEYAMFGSVRGRRVTVPIDFTQQRFYMRDHCCDFYEPTSVTCPLTGNVYYSCIPMNGQKSDDINYGETWFFENCGRYVLIFERFYEVRYPVSSNGKISIDFKIPFSDGIIGEPLCFKNLCDVDLVKIFKNKLEKENLQEFAKTLEKATVMSAKHIHLEFKPSSAYAMTVFSAAELLWKMLESNYVICEVPDYDDDY